jgi:hypothetical protein
MTTILFLILVVLLITTGLLSGLLRALGGVGVIAVGLYLFNGVFGLSYDTVLVGGAVLVGIGGLAIGAIERAGRKQLRADADRRRAEREQQRQSEEDSVNRGD